MLEQLSQFSGTEHYYSHWTKRLRYTDGVKYLADEAGAYWLIDIIASYQTSPAILKSKEYFFQIWELTKDEKGNGAIVTMKEDTRGSPVLIKQKIPFTDFPLNYFKLYLIDGILLLPSEY